MSHGFAKPEGTISMKIIRSGPAPQPRWYQRLFAARSPHPVEYVQGASLQSQLIMSPSLHGKVFRAYPKALAWEQFAKLKELLAQNVDVTLLASPFRGEVIDYGCLSRRTITDNGVTALAAGFAGAFTISNFKYHAFGTGTTAEAEAHANLVTELTTEYVVNSTRLTGSQANTAGAGGPPQIATYVTVGTLSPDSGGTLAITEHGLFSNTGGVGGGANTMFDRSVFSAVNLVSGSPAVDSLQVTYTLSLTANG